MINVKKKKRHRGEWEVEPELMMDSLDINIFSHELHILGIIKQDPKLPMDKILPPPSPWPKSIFDADEEKSKVRTSP